jgi:hypothetical protein
MQTRESYLREAALGPLQRDVFVGYTIPNDVQITCGWPSRGGTSKANGAKTIGECWARRASSAGVNEVFLSPVLSDTVEVLATLVHELVHAIVDCNHGHGKEFRKIAVACGLSGPMTATYASEELQAKLERVRESMGEYPHSKLNPPLPRQKSRQLKLSCGGCGAVWRMSKKWLALASLCPCCGSDEIKTS